MSPTRTVALVAVVGLFLLGCQADGDQAGTVTPTATPSPTPDDGTDAAVDDEVLERVATAAANTVDEGTARFTITVEMPSDADTDAGTDTGTGTDTDTDNGTDTGTDTGTGTDTDTDNGTDTGTDTGTHAGTSGALLSVEGQVDFDEELRELEFQGPQGQLTAIIDADELYVQLPATEEGEWARVQLDELTDDEVGFGGPAGIPFQDPQQTLDALRDAAIEARQLDGEPAVGATSTPTPTMTPDDDDAEVDLDATATPDETETGTPTPGGTPGETETGTPTPGATPGETETGTPTPGATPGETETGTPGATAGARYLVVVDLAQAGDRTAGDTHGFAAMAEHYGIETLDMEIQVDGQERIERISYTLPLSEARVEDDDLEEGADDAVDTEVDPQRDLVVTIQYRDFGTDVDITLPDEDMVVDIDEGQIRQQMPPADAPATPRAGRGSPTPTATPDVGGGTASPTPTATPTPTSTATPSPTPTS